MIRKVLWLLFMISFVLVPSAFAEPLTATTALALLTAIGGTAGVGYGVGEMFGAWGKHKRDVNDPLSGIRAQLQALASTGLNLEEMQNMIRKRTQQRKTEGMGDIAEEVYASRQVPGSIHTKLVTDFLDKLATGEEESLLNAEIMDKKFRMGSLQTAMGYPPPEEEPTAFEQMLPIAGSIGGQYLAKQGEATEFKKILEMINAMDEVKARGGATVTTQ